MNPSSEQACRGEAASVEAPPDESPQLAKWRAEIVRNHPGLTPKEIEDLLGARCKAEYEQWLYEQEEAEYERWRAIHQDGHAMHEENGREGWE